MSELDRFAGGSRTNSAYWQRTRRKVIQRDSVRGQPFCTSCGVGLDKRAKKGEPGAIEVDHVLAYVDRPDLEFELSNLVTLCQPCHKKKSGHESRVRNAKAVGRDVDEWTGRERSTLKAWYAYVGESAVITDPMLTRTPQPVRCDANGELSIGWGSGNNQIHRVWTGRRWITPSEMHEEFPPGRVPDAERPAA